jgi:hypothetical protein
MQRLCPTTSTYLSLKLKQYTRFVVYTRYRASVKTPSCMVWLFRELGWGSQVLCVVLWNGLIPGW